MIKLLISLLFINLISLSSAFVMQLENPNFSPSGKAAKQSCMIINTNTRLLPLEIYVAKRTYNEAGEELLEEVDDDFLIIPQQLVLTPGEEKIISVVWNGPSELKNELAYRLIGEEFPLPDDDSDDGGQASQTKKVAISILIKNMRAMYVAPAGASPKIQLADVNIKKETISFSIENNGSAHRILKEISLAFGQSPNKQEIDLSGTIGNINLLVADKRVYTIQIPDGLDLSPQAIPALVYD
jgi:fimbrial chaperone protein